MTNMLPPKERDAALKIAGPLARAVFRWIHAKTQGTWEFADYSLDDSLRRELKRINKMTSKKSKK